jgi:hypothetical protein
MGSEQISRKWLEGQTHCAKCGMKFTNLKQVGHLRTVYPGRRREVFCVECAKP